MIPIEWANTLRALLRTAEELLREHAADQSYIRDTADKRAKLWHQHQHENAIDTAHQLAEWQTQLRRAGIYRPSRAGIAEALTAAESATAALEQALAALRPEQQRGAA